MKKLTKLCIGLTGLVGAITPAVFATSCCLNRKQEPGPEPAIGVWHNLPTTFNVPCYAAQGLNYACGIGSDSNPIYVTDPGQDTHVNVSDYQFKIVWTEITSIVMGFDEDNGITMKQAPEGSTTDFKLDIIHGAWLCSGFDILDVQGYIKIQFLSKTNGDVVYESHHVNLVFVSSEPPPTPTFIA